MSIQFVPVCVANRERVNDFIQERWLSLRMIVRGRAVDMSGIDGVAAVEDGRLVGLVTYIVTDETLEIMSLDSVEEGRGTGTALLGRAVAAAREKGCARVALITTNDNVKALRFYQKRGFDMARLYRDALEVSRKLKLEIPLIGMDGIPLRHEIELEMKL